MRNGVRHLFVMKQIGITVDGRKLVSGLFKIHDSMGFPLSIMFSCCIENDIQPCWISFYKEAKKGKWTVKAIKSRLFEAILDAYGKAYYDEFTVKFNKALLIMG